MDSISNVISDKADELFQTPTVNDPVDNKEEDILDLESTDTEHNSEVPVEVEKDTTIEIKKGLNIDLLKIKKMIHSMKDQLDTLLRHVNGEQVSLQSTTELNSEVMETGERIVEGIFDGEKMIGPDEREYSVPPNYASKSKLVEGDKMKLTITNNGRFIYKQIDQIERKRLTGELVSNEDQWSVLADGKTYKVLTASVTFYKGKPGDEVIFFVADDGSSSWGAVENIIHKHTNI